MPEQKPILNDEWWDRLHWLRGNDPKLLQRLLMRRELRAHLDSVARRAQSLEADAAMITDDPVEIRLAACPVVEPETGPVSQGPLSEEAKKLLEVFIQQAADEYDSLL